MTKRNDDKHKKPDVKPGPQLVLKPNKRDRSNSAEEKRKKHITMSFLGFGGLIRALINYKSRLDIPYQQPKGSRRTAAVIRSRPLRHYFADDPDKLRACLIRHIHPRSKRRDKAYVDSYVEARIKAISASSRTEDGG